MRYHRSLRQDEGVTVRALIVLALVGALFASGNPVDARTSLPVVMLGCDTTWGDNPGEGSFRLGNNLDCDTAASPFLQIVRSNIVVDLGGHRITGSTFVNGLRIFDRTNVTVRNGVIGGYDYNIIAGRVQGLKLQNLTTLPGNPSTPGIEVQDDSTGIEITGNTLIDDTSINLKLDVNNSVVSGNTLVNSAITMSDGVKNKISGNRVLGAAAVAAPNGISISGASSNNSISGNRVIGAVSSGIEIAGNDADGNVVRSNTVRGNAIGVLVDEGDTNRILNNTVSGNGDGVALLNGAEGTVVQGNKLLANRDRGVDLVSADDARISDNKVVENGGTGIEAVLGNNPVISGNRVDFNGFDEGLNGLLDQDGIDAPGATGNGNTAQGNDVLASQCNPSGLCNEGSAPPPPLRICGSNVTAAFTLRHPLTCDSSTNALLVSGSGYTLNLGHHVLTAGNNATDGAIKVNNAASDVRIVGGTLMDSEHGVFTPDVNPASQISVVDSVIARNDNEGVFLQGEDALPDDAVITAGRNLVEGSTLVANGASGVLVSEAPRNTFRSNTIAGGGAGIDISQSVGNRIEANAIRGTTVGLDIGADGGTEPVRQKITRNTIVGSEFHGIEDERHAREQGHLEHASRQRRGGRGGDAAGRFGWIGGEHLRVELHHGERWERHRVPRRLLVERLHRKRRQWQ